MVVDPASRYIVPDSLVQNEADELDCVRFRRFCVQQIWIVFSQSFDVYEFNSNK